MTKITQNKNPKLLVGVTVGMSAYTLLRGQLSWFREKEWDVSLVTTPDQAAKDASIREQVPLNGIPMQRNISPKEDAQALFHWINLLLSERPDAINVGTPKASLLGLMSAWIIRVPKRLYVVRGLRLEGVKGPMKTLLWAIERFSMMLATDVLFVSQSLAHEADKKNLLIKRKSWLIGEGSSNGVNVASIESKIDNVNLADLRDELDLQVDDFVVGFIGRISMDKGVDLLVEATNNSSLNPKVKCIFIGGIEDEELGEQLRKVEHKVRVIPWTDDPWIYLKIIDVLCLPSNREGFPNVVLEAAAAGKPAIVTRATGNVDSVIDGKTGAIVDLGDVGGLVDAMNSMCSNSEKTRVMGKDAKQRVADKFQPEQIWSGLEEILSGQEATKFARRVN